VAPYSVYNRKRARERRSISLVENKAVVRRLIEEVYNAGNLDVVDELVAPDVFNHPAVREHSTASIASSTSSSGYAPSAPTGITTSRSVGKRLFSEIPRTPSFSESHIQDPA